MKESPYSHNRSSTNRMMFLVLVALIPGIIAQRYYFGWGGIIQIIITGIIATSSEAIIAYLRQLPILETLKDNSALITGLLIGISIPPLAPWWLATIGTLFAIIIAKHLYGGLGQNLFNPAMIGYVMLLISFPVQMTSWIVPDSLQIFKLSFHDTFNVIFCSHKLNFDGVTQATPMDTFKTEISIGNTTDKISKLPIYNGIVAGLGWEWISIYFFVGGVFLLLMKCIRWHIPVSFLLTLIFCATLGWFILPDRFASPLIHIFSSATMLCAFFIATDPVTASTTNKGRLLYGMIIGLLVWIIRSFGGYPDGVAFAVILSNICVPLIDYYTRPRVYGHFKKRY